ncbi:cytochrome c oxidase assembly protein [Pseudarthrobacter sp. NPDC058329]|uniref:cytochrome c oxidase assembly protein n=1 Tax=Pseudarthrobacter sp. NPDC058329 TaxID=3346448 RepID=UPI0036DBF4F1
MSLRTHVVAWLVLLAAGVLSLVWAYTFGGGANPGLLDRAGPAVAWGLPTAKVVFNLASAGTIGALVLAVFALPRRGTPYERALLCAGWSAVAWTGAAAAHTYASFLLLANLAPTTGFGAEFLNYLTRVDAGRAGALSTLIAAAVAVSCFHLRNPRILALTIFAAFAGLLPLVMKSHAAGGTDHADSTTALFVHAAAAAVWLGGLLTLVVLRPVLRAGQLAVTVRRYSTLALIGFIALVVSGFLGALSRISSVEALLSPYGVIVLAKAGVFVILGLFGVLHRRWSLGRIEKHPERGGRHFAALAVVELAVMGAASGLAAALARTQPPPPAGSGKTSAADFAAGLPEPGLWEYLSRWTPDPLWSLACGFAVFVYLAGVRRLQTGGRPWPAYRTVAWLAGVAVLFLVTNGGVHVYQGYLFNAHVLTQMMLTAVVPLLLVPAAPLTLAKLAVRSRTDGSTGVKEFLERSVNPVLAAMRRDPILSIFLLAASLLVTYYTPLLEWAAVGQIGYSTMTVLTLVTGSLAIAALTGEPDPGTSSSSRLFVLAGIGGVYAFGGWKLMEQAGAMEMPWYTSVGQPWGPSPAAAPETGGIIMWSVAALSLAVTAAMVIYRRGRSPRNHVPGQADSAARRPAYEHNELTTPTA